MPVWGLRTLQLAPYMVGFLVMWALRWLPPEGRGTLIVLAIEIATWVVLVLISNRTRAIAVQHRRVWNRLAVALTLAVATASAVYSVALDQRTFLYDLEGPDAKYLRGAEYAPRAAEHRAKHPAESDSELVANFGGSRHLDLVWTAESRDHAAVELAILCALMLAGFGGALFAVLELARFDTEQRQQFPRAVPRQIASQRSGGKFDVFLCHNSQDKPAVKAIARDLIDRGIVPWLDEWELRPGTRWIPAIEAQLRRVPAAAIFVGAGVGPWQDLEVDALLREFVKRGAPAIPVLLKGSPPPADLPAFLDILTWVKMDVADPDPIDQIEFGIRGVSRTQARIEPVKTTSGEPGQ